jgi:hypothetical protein
MRASIELDVAPLFCALIPREVWTHATEYLTIFDQNLRRFEQKWGKASTQHKFRRGTRPEHVQRSPVDFNMASPRRWGF